jgi:hypothetical protein
LGGFAVFCCFFAVRLRSRRAVVSQIVSSAGLSTPRRRFSTCPPTCLLSTETECKTRAILRRLCRVAEHFLCSPSQLADPSIGFVGYGYGCECRYEEVPTVVFSHPPIGTIGLTEAEAVETYGEDTITKYTSTFVNMYYSPWQMAPADKPKSYVKLICTGAKNASLSPFFMLKTISLPRQARDKHRENSKKEMRFSQGRSSGWLDCT